MSVNVKHIFLPSLVALAGAPIFADANTAPAPNRSFLETKLARENFSPDFVRDLLASYEAKDFEQVVELNVLLFLRKSDYHGIQVTPEAEREVRRFENQNRSALERAERENQVPRGVVASLLWIESRHGRNTGNFHVPSVYLHLLQAPRKVVQNYLLTRVSRYTDQATPEDIREIMLRTHKKSAWALEELRALEKVHRWKWKMGADFRGSFSGAFGIPQFLPSSYIRWARSLRQPAVQPNLSGPGDAIMSVSYYLRDHGWKPEENATHVEALMAYNKSRDYANAILALAEKLKTRGTASESGSRSRSRPR